MTLRDLRQQAGMTQQQLATKAGVDMFTVANLEQRRVKRPQQAMLTRLAWALGVSVDMIELPCRNGGGR